jgi:organic hydroperoxide reductase OsmC/OhrA
MLGTLAASLAARQIPVPQHALTATVEGVNELRDGVVTLTSIRIHYTLSIPPQHREAADRALSRHQEKCPTAQSLKAAVDVSWTASITEEGPAGATGA